MKREIKFRVWDNLKKSFLKDKSVLIHTEKPFVQHDQGHIFQQFTGFKDKNNKEIYEGDILQPEGLDKGIVEFCDGGFKLNAEQTSDFLCYLIYGGESVECEVIGNIFENKNFKEVYSI